MPSEKIVVMLTTSYNIVQSSAEKKYVCLSCWLSSRWLASWFFRNFDGSLDPGNPDSASEMHSTQGFEASLGNFPKIIEGLAKSECQPE